MDLRGGVGTLSPEGLSFEPCPRGSVELLLNAGSRLRLGGAYIKHVAVSISEKPRGVQEVKRRPKRGGVWT